MRLVDNDPHELWVRFACAALQGPTVADFAHEPGKAASNAARIASDTATRMLGHFHAAIPGPPRDLLNHGDTDKRDELVAQWRHAHEVGGCGFCNAMKQSATSE